MDKSRSLFHAIVNGLLFVAGVLALCAGGYMTLRLQAVTATTFFGTALILLFASTIDRFESLKGFGMEAKQRELNKTLSEVQEVLDEVQRLTVFTTKSLATLYAKAGRLNGAPAAEEMYAIVTALQGSMKRAQSSEDTIREALQPCVRAMLYDFNYAVISQAISALRVKEAELQADLHATASTDLETRQLRLNAWRAMAEAATAVLDFRDFSEGTYPWGLIDVLRSHPANSVMEASTAANTLGSFAADIQNLQRKGIIDDPAAWFAVTKKAA